MSTERPVKRLHGSDAVRLKNQLTYDPDTGIFKWKESGKGRRSNLIAGCVRKKGTNVWRKIRFEGEDYTSGQLAWLLMTGVFPGFIIDHIDGDPLNDRWSNLRRGDKCVAQRNLRKNSRNKTGVSGVRYRKRNKTFVAYIGAGAGNQKYLGCSPDFFEAVCLRKSEELKLGYSERHGT